MVDILIPLGNGSMFNNMELYYCLRSIDKYLTGYDKIYIVGDAPGFDTGFLSHELVHIPVQDHGFNYQDNIRRKIEVACALPQLSDSFFFANDDYVFLKPLDVNNLPYYYSGNLDLAYKRKRKVGSYKSALESTRLVLEEKDYATYHFDIHVPIIYNKRLFPEVMQKYDWKTCRWGYVIKSLYCNSLMIQGVELPDMMIGYSLENKGQIEEMIKDRFVFAYNNEAANEVMFNYLKELFP